jgi:hypothetical protein
MEEARDRNSASYVPGILAAWTKVGQMFSGSRFPRFAAMGPAIQQEVKLEQAMVDTYSAWGTAASQQILPLMEEILTGELIPQYQRAVVVAFPDISQLAAQAVAQQSSQPDQGRGTMLAAMWRTSGQLVGGDTDDASTRTLPVIDPEQDAQYIKEAQQQRAFYAQKYLNDWNSETMLGFDEFAKMTQFGALWRSFTCGYLQKLLADYPTTNLPHVILPPQPPGPGMQAQLQQYYIFLGVAYWKQAPQMMPRIFDNPNPSSAVAYAEVYLFIPRQRLVWRDITNPFSSGPGPTPLGGVPGDFVDLLPPAGPPVPSGGGGGGHWIVTREGVPTTWDLLTQRWTCQLAPTTSATQPALVTILQSVPPLPAFSGANITPPSLGGLTPDDIGRISPH